MSTLPLLALLAVGPALVAEAPPDPAPGIQALGRQHAAQFQRGELEALWQHLAPEARSALGSPEGLRAYREQVHRQVGREVEVVHEQVVRAYQLVLYLRTVRTDGHAGLVDAVWSFDHRGRVRGFAIGPKRPVPGASPSP